MVFNFVIFKSKRITDWKRMTSIFFRINNIFCSLGWMRNIIATGRDLNAMMWNLYARHYKFFINIWYLKMHSSNIHSYAYRGWKPCLIRSMIFWHILVIFLFQLSYSPIHSRICIFDNSINFNLFQHIQRLIFSQIVQRKICKPFFNSL